MNTQCRSGGVLRYQPLNFCEARDINHRSSGYAVCFFVKSGGSERNRFSSTIRADARGFRDANEFELRTHSCSAASAIHTRLRDSVRDGVHTQ